MAPPSPPTRADASVPSDASLASPSTGGAPPTLFYHPLPQVQPRSGVWRGRGRYVDFKVRKLDAPKSSSSRSPLNVTWDRSQPCQALAFPQAHLPGGPHPREVGLLMGALADLKANVVVTLGQDRLSEAQAQKHIRLYEEYQAQKATMKDKALIRTTDKRGNRQGRKRRK